MVIYRFFSGLINKINPDFLFDISVISIFVFCVFLLVIKIIFSLTDKKAQLIYNIFAFSVCFFNCGVNTINNSVSYFFFLLCESLLLNIMLIAINKKGKKEQKELVRFIDEKIKDASIIENGLNISKANGVPERLVCKTQEEDKNIGDNSLDFGHIANVIERVNTFSLSAVERKQIADLESSIILLKRGEDSLLNKEKINDGLGALLKIMSKYGA